MAVLCGNIPTLLIMNKDAELHEIKAEVYETWGVINRAFEQIISALNKLQKMGVLSDDYVTDQDTITNDLWARINSQLAAEARYG